jgi:hypothetical protein
VQYGVTWRIPESFRSRIDPAVLRHIDARNEGRFVPAPPQIYPWADARGDPELVLEAQVRVPTVSAHGGGAHAQFNFMVYLLDTASGKFFSYIVNLYQHPAEPMKPAHVENDGEFAFISAQMPRDGTPSLDMRHFRRAAASRGSSVDPWTGWRFFRICIGREHLGRAIADLNRSDVPGARDFGADPARYLLTGAGVIQEHVVHRGESVLMASSTREFALSIARKRPPR